MGRKDAKRIKEVDGFHSIIPYMMPKRTEAEVSSQEKFDVTELVKYLEKKNEGIDRDQRTKIFHACCYAIAKTIYLRPKLNIFVAGRRYWQRNDITLSFVAKQKFNDESEETLMFIKAVPEMTLDSISAKIRGDVKEAREKSGNDLGDMMDFVGKLPRFVLTIFFAILRRLEYHGIMPQSLTAGDPNYSTALLSNLGSIGAGTPYHHLNNYGTNSLMGAIGTIHKEKCLMPDGSEEVRDILPMSFNLDERIADGFYFAKSLRITRYLLEHPAHLEERLDAPIPELCN